MKPIITVDDIIKTVRESNNGITYKDLQTKLNFYDEKELNKIIGRAKKEGYGIVLRNGVYKLDSKKGKIYNQVEQNRIGELRKKASTSKQKVEIA